jgi:his kinase A (phosphoacceptor) domain./histidine kinase-, DNA gyrase B-, and HSP90-like ATPase
MKSRYIKRRKKFHYIIISVTIIVCLLGTVFTSLAILNSSKDLLVANAENELKMKMIDLEHNLGINLTDSQDDKVNGAYPYNDKVGLLNENVDKSNTYYQITDKKNLTITTDNVLTVYYISQNRNYISFDVIKNLLSDNENKEICGYLNTPTDNDGNYYILICKKFYESEKYGYVPCQLEVLKTNKVNDWYVQDEVVKTYSFDLSKYDYLTIEELEASPFENDEMHRNIIDKDFFLGKSKPKYSQKDVEKILSDNSLFTDIYDETGAVPDGIFKYYLLMGDCLYYTENHMINNSPNEYKEVTRVFHITSLKEINLLDDCLWKFITVFAVAFTIMAVVITVEIFSWKDFKRRTAQEETRLEMTNAIAHNLKTPLFVIGGFAENLKNEEDTEKKLHNIEIIQQQTEEMDILIHRMLDLSRFDSPALKLNCEVFDFKPFIEKILENYYVHTEHEIIFIYNSKAKIKADPAMLKTVLENLIDNAEKYSDYGSDITINVSDDVLSISNQCSSFDRENLSKLWQPYFRAAKGDNKSGSGIGLSIVKSALEMHGFKYKAEFENGIITFKFRFTSLD